MAESLSTWHLHITGQVQGVGYRPLVYNVAVQYGLTGWVKNDLDGLYVCFNAKQKQAEVFTQIISHNSKPQLARIDKVLLKQISTENFTDFLIIQETTSQQSAFSVSPDVALCEHCKHELRDDTNRRFGYPFISCTQCGPRYSIVNALPYERHLTAMDSYALCAACQFEYEDSTDRRYYAQTHSCLVCGIQQQLFDSSGQVIATDSSDIVHQITQYWSAGKIVAIKGIGGFLLTCDAQNPIAIQTLRSRKQRPSKPFAIMLPHSEYFSKMKPNVAAQQALNDHVSPIVLIQKELIDAPLVGVADSLDTIGVMIPYAPLFQFLLDDFKQPIIATSGNQTQQPIIYTNEDALSNLKKIADYILVNDREIIVPQDDSVIRYTDEAAQKIILRRSRGLAPYCIQLPEVGKDLSILCMGGQLKSTLCLSYQDKLIVSQYLGNLEQFETQKRYESLLDHFLELLLIQPGLICLDNHPDYFTSAYAADLAKLWQIPVFKIQHHRAHFAAILGEHRLVDSDMPVLGVIWDGTGYGDDGMIWGGEFFKYEMYSMTRCAQVAYYDHFLQDKMAHEPRIAALAICHSMDDAVSVLQDKFSEEEWRIYHSLLNKDNGLQTSSMGRLFDAIASVLGILDVQSYEGEAAMLLEAEAKKYVSTHKREELEYYAHEDLLGRAFCVKRMMSLILKDKELGKKRSYIAAKFHYTLVRWIYGVAQLEDCKRIAFSGGVFQNALLVDLIFAEYKNDFTLYFHQELSPNDENLSYGQNIYYRIQHKLKEKN